MAEQVLREHLPLRSTGWPGLLTGGSLKVEEGALAGLDWLALQGHQKIGRSAWNGARGGKVTVGLATAQPGTDRLV